jgi:hypothetical protein
MWRDFSTVPLGHITYHSAITSTGPEHHDTQPASIAQNVMGWGKWKWGDHHGLGLNPS